MEERILVLAPQGRDAAVIQHVLADFTPGGFAVSDLAGLAAALPEGVGAVIATEEALAGSGRAGLVAWLDRQPSWSDLPCIVLATRQVGRRSPAAAKLLESIGNVVLLERPINAETLVSAARSGLRARRRQYQARDHLQNLAKAEERLRVALEAGRLGSWDLDLVQGTLVASANCKANFGWPPERAFSYDDLQSQLHPDDRDAQVAAVETSIRDLTDLDIEYRILWPDGGLHWVYVRGRTICDAAGGRVRMIGVSLDITARREADDELRRLNDTLEQRIAERTAALTDANLRLRDEMAERRRAEAALVQMQKMEAIGHLTGGIAHDFNNLLTAIVGNLEMIQRRSTDERVLRMAGHAGEAVARATRLTGQLLAFSRSQQLDLRPLQVAALLSGMDDLLQRSLGHGITLETRPGCGGASAMADANQLELAILNLAINARDAMGRAGRLTIGTRVAAAAGGELPHGDYVVIAVSDTGPGIPPAIVAKVFDPFFTTKQVGKGTGLGLSQVYGIARQCGGIARVQADRALGACIEIWLPVAAGVEAVGMLERPGQTPTHVPRGQGEAVLVVDDDEGVRRYVVACVDSLGYRVSEAADGRDGLALLAEEGPDLLIVDFAMPGLNGAEVAAEARRRRPELPIILLTGYADFSPSEVSREMDLVLRKPFHMDDLAVAIRQCLKKEWGSAPNPAGVSAPGPASV